MSNDFHFVGLLRTDQGNIMFLIGFLIFIGFLFIMAKKYMKLDPSEAHWPRRIAGVFVVIALIGYAWHFVGLVSANRMPRQDIDRTGVYDQMRQNRHLSE